MADLFRLDGRSSVIGAGSGIGRAVALGAARQGARVAVLDINEDAARTVARRFATHGARRCQTLDIVDGEGDRRRSAVIAKTDGSTALICTPSINVRKKLLDYAEDEFDRVVRINLKGSFNVVRAAGR